MSTDIRKYIVENFKENSEQEIREAIEESIRDKEEVTLPGLGVFFEFLWKQSGDEERNKILAMIKEAL